ncbi:hypothetical protein ACFLZ2_01025 [Candidatus Margulisiibacteriota bacterium]
MKRSIVLCMLAALILLALSGGSDARIFGRKSNLQIKSAAGVLSYTDVLGKVMHVVRGNPVIVYIK